MSKRIGVLVLILLALVGVGLIIPPISGIREPAARVHCQNNLKNIGLAIHGYYDIYKRFPSAVVDNPKGEIPTEKRPSWFFALLPYVEAMMDPNYSKGLEKSWDSLENTYWAKMALAFLVCPWNDKRMDNGYALTHYVGLSGVGKNAIHLPKDDPKAGFFGYKRQMTFADIKDGMANTITVAETLRDNGPWIQPGYATVRGLEPDDPPYVGETGQFGSNHPMANSPLFSRAPRITNVVFGDGSLRYLSPSVSPRVLEALVTIAGGEEIPKDF